MAFWTFLLLFCLASLLPILLAWRKAGDSTPSETTHDRAMYEARLSEVEADHKLGRIDDLAREAALAEEGRRYLRLSENTAIPKKAAQSRGSVFALLITILAVPALSVGIYSSIGNPHVGIASLSEPDPANQPTLEELVAVAEKRLATNPDDARGWEVLAPVYIRMGRLKDAEKAYRNLLRLNKAGVTAKQALAELLVTNGNGEVTGEALALFEEIMLAQPDNPRASYFVGLAAGQRGNADKARAIWTSMLDNAKGDEPWLETVRSQLAELDQSIPQEEKFDADQLEQINAMVDGLAARLAEETGTQEEWQRLIRSYLVLGKTEEADAAIERASDLFRDDPAFLAAIRELVSNRATGNN